MYDAKIHDIMEKISDSRRISGYDCSGYNAYDERFMMIRKGDIF